MKYLSSHLKPQEKVQIPFWMPTQHLLQYKIVLSESIPYFPRLNLTIILLVAIKIVFGKSLFSSV